MNTTYIRTAIAIQKLKSQSKAAEQLGVTQANVSATIRALHSEIGQEVFNFRRGKVNNVEVTPFGKKWLLQASNTLRSLETLEKLSA